MNRNISRIEEALDRRVLVLDGSMGVMLQRLALGEEGVRGVRFRNHHRPLASNLDILCLSRPEAVAGVHRAYLEAGADIIETNTFNANALSQREYGTEGLVHAINVAGARIAREEADRFTAADPLRPRFVAGSMGPTALSASLPVDVERPDARAVSFDELVGAYAAQAAGLIEGGVDVLLIETAFDLLNAKAAATGCRLAMEQSGRSVPLIFSMTVSDASGRILSGHTPEAFLAATAHFDPVAIGFNCSAGPAGLASVFSRFADECPFSTIFYPNAGLPDQLGNYILSTDDFVAQTVPLLREGKINIVGGCCGTTPEHIAALRRVVDSGEAVVRRAPAVKAPWLAGFDAFGGDSGFINVGERCNVAGSRRFLRLVKEGNASEALAIARRQVADGAMVLDINMDDAMIDAGAEMGRFLRLLGSDPATAAVPWMIDSSDFSVIEAALKNVGGKAIVNSISLRDGEETFLAHARTIAGYGAAVVVMLFDEEGQAATYERKISIAKRAYNLLTERCGYSPRDIIIDPNILTVATGLPEHDRYALDYIRAVEWITANLPGVRTSGGVSNLSFAFRGNNYLRQAMHAAFLYHAIGAGLSMAIVDPSTKVAYSDIPAELLERIDDVLLCRRSDAAERLTEIAAGYAEMRPADVTSESKAEFSVAERLALALRTGDDTTLEADLTEAVEVCGGAREVVEGPLMAGMEEVGRLFGCGKMFLPQVVKSSRTMRRAVEILKPFFGEDSSAGKTKGKILMATVRGDVHDIGKNICAVVLRCNNFEVIDLGVQVEARTIVEAALREKPDFIGLSGLISPSLGEMAVTAAALRRAGIGVPLFVGGAATTELHTALKIAPEYGDGLVVRVPDASANPVVASRLMTDYDAECLAVKDRQRKLVADYEAAAATAEPGKPSIRNTESSPRPSFTGVRTLAEVPVAEVEPYINYVYFNNCWRVASGSREAASLRRDAEEVLAILKAAGATMRAQVAFYDAYSQNDAIVVDGRVTVPTPRQKAKPGRSVCVALADFIAPEGSGDTIGCFAVTTGDVIRNMIGEARRSGDEYRSLLLQSVTDRLAEAASEWLHSLVRRQLWGYASDENLTIDEMRRARYRGIRPAVGYPSLPDQATMHTLMSLLSPADIGLAVTVNGALEPASSVAGFYIAAKNSRYFTID